MEANLKEGESILSTCDLIHLLYPLVIGFIYKLSTCDLKSDILST
jgi:hypothetical protein